MLTYDIEANYRVGDKVVRAIAISGGGVYRILCDYDGANSNMLWIGRHPLELINMPIFQDPKYKQWALEKYLNTGILHLRNDNQVAILEPGRFRIEQT
jgi:hypothetical protein